MAEVIACYGCKKYPHMRIRHLQFDNSVLEVTSERDKALVEGADGFGIFVFPLELNTAYDIKPENPTGQARMGMRSASNPADLPQEGAEPETREVEFPESVFPKTEWPQDGEPEKVPEDNSVLVKAGGWYEYQGKNYRKADLPDDIQRLL